MAWSLMQADHAWLDEQVTAQNKAIIVAHAKDHPDAYPFYVLVGTRRVPQYNRLNHVIGAVDITDRYGMGDDSHLLSLVRGLAVLGPDHIRCIVKIGPTAGAGVVLSMHNPQDTFDWAIYWKCAQNALAELIRSGKLDEPEEPTELVS